MQMDKASVLGDAVKYVKQLQEQVKALEDRSQKKTQSVVLVKRSLLCSGDDFSTLDRNSGGDEIALPEIEAKVSGRNLLIHLHCEKKKGVLVEALAEIEDLHLTVMSSSLVSFASMAVDITIVGQMEEEFCMSVKDQVKALRVALMA